MENETSPTRHATNQIDILHSLHTPLKDPTPASADEAGKKLPRKVRRQAFWDPIRQKINRQKERQHNNQATRGASRVDGSDPRGNVSRLEAVDSASRQSHGQQRNNGVQAGDGPNVLSGRRFRTHSQNPMRPRHDDPQADRLSSGRQVNRLDAVIASRPPIPVSVHRDPLHASLHNLRDLAYVSNQAGLAVANPGRQRAESQSSITHASEMAWPQTVTPPLVVVTLSGVDKDLTRPTPNPAEIHHSVMGIAPSTPYIPSVEDSSIDAELGSLVEPLQLLMPDPGSSNCAPRIEDNEWDGITQVADGQQPQLSAINFHELSSSGAVVEMSLSKMKEPIQTPDRSWTFPGRERSLSLLTSLGLEDTTTLVDEPLEFPSRVDSAPREVLRLVKSVDNFLSFENTDFWTALS